MKNNLVTKLNLSLKILKTFSWRLNKTEAREFWDKTIFWKEKKKFLIKDIKSLNSFNYLSIKINFYPKKIEKFQYN